ncbi:hypothetical protein ACYCFC_07465 [Stutzerimonas sp. NM35]
MARSSSIDSLDILDSLVQQYLDHPEWTLHRYLFGRKETLLQAQAEKDKALANEMSTRKRCLELASALYKGDDPKEMISIAEDLLDWIQQTDTARLPVESFFRE